MFTSLYSPVFIHSNTSQSNGSAFAIKKLKSRSLEKYKAEFNMLATFSKTEDPHLVPLRAAYRLRNACYFIFDWADTDLSRFWTFMEPRPPFNKDTVLWVARQCYGLANGLQTIHRYGSIEQNAYRSSTTADYEATPGRKLYGRHGDIKPQNILLFKDPEDPEGRGILKICDFGQAELHSAHSRSNRPNTDVAISLFYRPPECDIKGGTISRSYDIWTLGCLYLEFVAWMLGGWSLVTIFARQRAGPDIPWAPQLREHLFFDRLDEGRSAQVKSCVGEVNIHFFSLINFH
jgi:serine/threonine protein kinase